MQVVYPYSQFSDPFPMHLTTKRASRRPLGGPNDPRSGPIWPLFGLFLHPNFWAKGVDWCLILAESSRAHMAKKGSKMEHVLTPLAIFGPFFDPLFWPKQADWCLILAGPREPGCPKRGPKR
jgi:hypothetical protein